MVFCCIFTVADQLLIFRYLWQLFTSALYSIVENNFTLLYLKETRMNTSLSKAHYWILNLMKNIANQYWESLIFIDISYRRKEYLFTDMSTFEYVKSRGFILLFLCLESNMMYHLSNQDPLYKRKLRIWSHLLEKSLMENFIFCAVIRELINQLQEALHHLLNHLWEDLKWQHMCLQGTWKMPGN